MIAARGIARLQHVKVGRELDFAVFLVHCVAEIDDALVVRIGDWKREVDASRDALVGSGVTERLAVEDVGAGSNFDTGYTRVDWSVLDWNEPAIRFYRSLGALPMEEWTIYRLQDKALAEFVSAAGKGKQP